MKKKGKSEPQLSCEICKDGLAVAIMRNGKFACRDCAEEKPDEVLRWLK